MAFNGPVKIRRWLAPSLVDVFFVAVFLALFAHPAGLEALLADGDTGWHIRTGEMVLADGRVPAADPFSFSRAGQPWFAWEWLSDVIFALVHRWHGLAAVAALSGAVLALALALLLARLLQLGAGLGPALAAALAAGSASSIHYLARPHVFSILLFTVTLGWIEADLERPGRRVWLLIPAASLWANLHAAFVLLPAMLALAAATAQRGRRGRYALLSLATASATLLNPYGWRLHQHIWEYLRSPWILDHVQEFQSPSIRGEASVVFAVLLLAAVAVVARAEGFRRALVLGLAFASLRSARHIPFFAVAAAPAVAEAAASAWRRFSEARRRDAPDRVLWQISQDLGNEGRASVWLPVAGCLAVVLAARQGAQFPDWRFPIRAVEHCAPELLDSTRARVLTSDQWADFLIYRLYPRQRVFFDGRSDYYGPAIGADYRKLLAAGDGWRSLLRRYDFSAALLPHDWPLSTMLDREPGWRMVYRDSVAALFAREGSSP